MDIHACLSLHSASSAAAVAQFNSIFAHYSDVQRVWFIDICPCTELSVEVALWAECSNQNHLSIYDGLFLNVQHEYDMSGYKGHSNIAQPVNRKTLRRHRT